MANAEAFGSAAAKFKNIQPYFTNEQALELSNDTLEYMRWIALTVDSNVQVFAELLKTMPATRKLEILGETVSILRKKVKAAHA